MNTELVIFVLYLIVLLAVGGYFYKRTKGVEDYFIAGRGLGRWVLAFTHEASDLTGFLLLAFPGFCYMFGMAGIWLIWTGLTGVILTFTLNGITMRRFGARYGAITLPDVLETRYYDEEKHNLRKVSSILIAICAFLMISAQCIAIALILEMAFGFNYVTAVLIGGGAIIIYTVIGGMRAVVWTDVVQGALMIFGCTIAAILAVTAAGGIGGVFAGLRDIAPTLTTPFPTWAMVLMGIGFVLGGGSISYLGQVQFHMRYLGARSGRDLADAMVISLGIIVIFCVGAFLAGAASRVIYPEVSMLPGGNPENVLLHLFRVGFPGILSGLFLAAAMAAVMSSADSALLVAGSALSRDLFQKVLRPKASEKTVLRVSRYATAGIAIIGVLSALFMRTSVMWAVWLAWGSFAQFGPILVLGMYWKRATKKAALTALVVGFLVNIGWFMSGLHTIIHQAVPGMIVGTLLMVIISLLDKAPPKEIEEMVDYLRTGREGGAAK